MHSYRPAAVFALLLFSAAIARSQNAPVSTPTAADIMAKVAAHQDQSETERAHYVYIQHAKVSSRRGHTIMCEEITDYRVTPTDSGSRQQLVKVDGRQLVKGRYVTYSALLPDDSNTNDGAEHETVSVTVGGDDADRSIVENMRSNLLGENPKAADSKDGIAAHLFPLTSKEQGNYLFSLIGRERLNGRDVFHIEFRPKDKSDYSWKGDAFIDTESYQPVSISTNLSRHIPLAVRMLLGTNVPGLGFTVVYAPQPDGIWFPASFSTEFQIHVLFFFRRTVIIDAYNRDFEKTHVSSRILSEATPGAPQP